MKNLTTTTLALGLGVLSLAGQSKSPNIILILTDDQGWNGTSVMMDKRVQESKSDYYETPATERMAKNGMRFSNAYSPSPLCTPSRRSIQYGMTVARQHGSMFTSNFVPTDHTSIPQMLKSINPSYAAAHFGKWGEEMGASPEAVGYDESDGETGNITGGLSIPSIRESEFFEEEDPKLIFSITQRAMDFMERMQKAERPFYVQISHYAPHLDMQGTKESYEKYKNKPPGKIHTVPGFAAMTEDMDAGIGLVLDRVKELGLEDNTYIIFTSDNGGRSAVGRRRTSLDPPDKPSEMSIIGSYELNVQYLSPNYPLLGSKHNLFEGGIRVPFIVQGPGVKPGSQCNTPVTQWDLFPTFVDFAGGYPGNMPDDIDGGSFKKLLLREGKGRVHRKTKPLIFHYNHPNPDRAMSAIRDGKYKLVRLWGEDRNLLFNLDKDIGELNDLSAKESRRANKLYRQLMDYFTEVGESWPGKND